jgi:hypothetical protein
MIFIATWNAVHTAEDKHLAVLTSMNRTHVAKCSTDIGRVCWIANGLASKLSMEVQL